MRHVTQYRPFLPFLSVLMPMFGFLLAAVTQIVGVAMKITPYSDFFLVSKCTQLAHIQKFNYQ